MKRRAFVLGGLAAAALPAWPAGERFSRGLLWRVARKGVEASHVFGTIHVPDARLAELPEVVRKRFDASRSLMLEFVADGYARERFLEAAMFLDRQTLDEKIGEQDFERAVEHLGHGGIPREVVRKLKPWAVLLNLRNPQQAARGVPLDAQLLERARARRMPLSQIEGVEEQIFTFDEFPMEAQVALLKHSLAHREELAELAERTLEAYLRRDVGEIWRLRERFVERHPQIAAHQAVMTRRVLHDRSVIMAFRMQRELRHGRAFVAVGALHLHGPKGILALLEQDGYRAARVY